MEAAEAWHVTRTLRAIELLAARPRSAPELADGLGIHVRTARRILRRFEDAGYAARIDDSHRRRRYRVTMRIVALAGMVVAHDELTKAAAERVERLHAQLGEPCHLCVPSYMSVFCLVHAGRDPACRPQLRELVPCHCTAAGKALLAYRESWREAVLSQPLVRFTDRTMVGPEWLRRDLRFTVARGFSIEDREYALETRAVAAPVFVGGEAVAALGVVAPVERLPTERFREFGLTVASAAATLAA